MAYRQFANSANPATTLASSYTSGGASLSMNSVANLPANVEYIVGVSTSSVIEWFLVTAKSGSGPYTLTVTGAQEGSSAANHNSGDNVYLVATAGTVTKVLQDTLDYGTYASRPVSTTGARTGMTYRCSDSPYEYVFNGSLWVPRVFGYEVTEPVLGNFTQVAVDKSTFDSTHGGIIQTLVAAGSTLHLQVLAQAIPGSGAYYVDAACIPLVSSSNGCFGTGLSAGTLVSSAVAFNEVGYDSGSAWIAEKSAWGSTTSFSGSAGGANYVMPGPLIWTRVYDDRTTNRTFYISTNGYTWLQVYQEARTTTFTPNQGCLISHSYASTVHMHWVHFSIHA